MKKTLIAIVLLFAGSARATVAPTAPAAQIVGHSVGLSWVLSTTPNTSSNVKRSTTSGSGYTTLINTLGTTYTDTSVVSGTTYFYVVSAVDTTGAESANSAQVAAAIPGVTPPPPPPPACATVPANTWSNQVFAAQTGTFTASFDATPASAAMDSVIGLSNAAAAAFTSLGPIVWFNPSGAIQARNGANYTAVTAYRYAASTAYHVTLTINVAARTYSASVHTGAAADTAIATNYAFRTEQAAVTQLTNFAAFTNVGQPSISVCNFTLGNAPPPPVTVTIAPTSKSLQEGLAQQFTATVGNSTNTAVTWTSVAGTVSPTGLFTAGSVPMSGSVTATSVADPTKSASATVTVTAPPPSITLACAAMQAGILTANIPSGTPLTVSVTGDGTAASCSTTAP